jgi:transporter family protein
MSGEIPVKSRILRGCGEIPVKKLYNSAIFRGSLDRRTLLFLTLSGLATGLSWLCYFRALQLGPASRVAPIDKLSVPLVILFAWLLLGEKLTPPTLIGGLLITAGAVVIALG